MTRQVHNFGVSLASSHKANDLPIWNELYRNVFPDFIAMIDHREDGEHQRAGIDRSIILSNSKQILIDEKIRWKAYEDILLEYWSDEQRRVPGWVCKPLRADYIAYAVAPLGKGYLLPVIQLQAAWQKHGSEWIRTYWPPIEAINKDGNREWTTVSVAVPVKPLFVAVVTCLRGTFTKLENSES